jgi:hypothetical protein
VKVNSALFSVLLTAYTHTRRRHYFTFNTPHTPHAHIHTHTLTHQQMTLTSFACTRIACTTCPRCCSRRPQAFRASSWCVFNFKLTCCCLFGCFVCVCGSLRAQQQARAMLSGCSVCGCYLAMCHCHPSALSPLCPFC